MPERLRDQGREPQTLDQTQPGLRRGVTKLITGITTGVLLNEAGRTVPNSRFGPKMADHITFLPHQVTRSAIGSLLKFGGYTSIYISFRKSGPVFTRLADYTFRKHVER